MGVIPQIYKEMFDNAISNLQQKEDDKKQEGFKKLQSILEGMNENYPNLYPMAQAAIGQKVATAFDMRVERERESLMFGPKLQLE